MLNHMVFFVSRVVMNVMVHINIIELKVGPYLFHSPTVMISQMYNYTFQSVVTLYLSSMDSFRCTACSFPEYFNPKPSNNKVKLNVRLLCVHSPRVCMRGGIHNVPCFYQGIMCYSYCLWEYIHLLIYLCEYVLIVIFPLNIVFVYRFLCYHGYLYHDIFCSIYLVVKVKIFYIHAYISLFGV